MIEISFSAFLLMLVMLFVGFVCGWMYQLLKDNDNGRR